MSRDRRAARERPRATGRRRGVIPGDLRQRIDAATPELSVRMAARLIARALDGLHPSALSDEERTELLEAWGAELAVPALTVLAEVGYGEPPRRRARRERAHGRRRDARLGELLGELPRSLALRLPTSADTHRRGHNDGVDRWGEVRCSRTLRPAHLGLVAALGGLWRARSEAGVAHVDVTAGELVQLLTRRRRVGGRDVAWVHGLLADLEQLELRAEVDHKAGASRSSTANGDGADAAHRIPSTPVERVERRVGGRWVAAGDYADAVAAVSNGDGDELVRMRAAERGGCAGTATIRVHLAAWVRAALAHTKRRPVFLNFAVWGHLRPQAQRTYAFVQAHGRDSFDGRIYFYLAAPTLYTLGLRGQRLDRARAIVSHDLAALWHADRRYREGSGFRCQTHAGTNLPAFACDAARRPSAPTATARAAKSAARRPGELRGAGARLRRHRLIEPAGGGDERRAERAAARREVERVRQAIQRSLGEAKQAAAAAPCGTARRSRGRGRDDDPPGVAAHG